MRISDWSSDVCSSDLDEGGARRRLVIGHFGVEGGLPCRAVGPFGDADETRAAAGHILAMQARAERAVFFADQFGPAAPRRAKLLFLARFHLPPIGRDETGFAQLSSCHRWQLLFPPSSFPAARNQYA